PARGPGSLSRLEGGAVTGPFGASRFQSRPATVPPQDRLSARFSSGRSPPSYLYWFSGRRSVRLEELCEPRAETANVTEFGVIPVTRPSPRASPGFRM